MQESIASLFLMNPYLSPSLKSKGRGITGYIIEAFTLPLLFKGRVKNNIE
jgi:hypothetical protein